jgi:hypothetical protein
MRTALPSVAALALLVASLLAAPAAGQETSAAATGPDGQTVTAADVPTLPEDVYNALLERAWNEAHGKAPLVLRAYDVRLLLAEGAPDYTFAATQEWPAEPYYYGGGGVSLFGDARCEDQVDTPAEALQKLIEHSIRAIVHTDEVWGPVGGRGTMRVVQPQGILLVNTTESMHARVAPFLDELRARVPADLAVQVLAVEFDEATVRRLVSEGFIAARTADERAALYKAMARIHEATLLTGRSGQTLSHNVGRRHVTVGDAEPVVAENAVAWDPVMDSVLEGLAVKLRAEEVGEGRVRVDARFSYVRAVGASSMVVEGTTGNPPGGVARSTVDKPVTLVDDRAATLTLELDCPTVVAGGLVPAGLVADDAAAASGKMPLYYVITVRRMAAPGK